MMLYPNKPEGTLRSWRGRRHGYTINIKEVFNDDLQAVDKYSFSVSSSARDVHYDSNEEGRFYSTVDLAKNASIKYINSVQRKRTKMAQYKERPVYLKSCNIHNFRHGVESPRIIDLIHYTPTGLPERLCFKVKYDSDSKIDYISASELKVGEWEIIR